jgi:Cu-processing system permease protein
MIVSRTLRKIARYEFSNVARSRWLVPYTLGLALLAEMLIRFSGTATAALLGAGNLMLLVIPLVSLVVGTMYFYSSRSFVELMLAQPVRRRELAVGLLLGSATPLAAGFLAGVGIPLAVHGAFGAETRGAAIALLGSGALLSTAFAALAFFISVRIEDRLRGLATAIGLWLVLALAYDGVILVATAVFSDYPLEKPLLGAMLLNPVDLARVWLMLQLDVAALLGYTGAVLRKFFGSGTGVTLAATALVAWTVVPMLLGVRRFEKRDF